MKRRVETVGRFAGVLFSGLLMVGCGSADSQPAGPDASVRVVCTTGQVADLLRNVGGRHVAVDPLMGPGVDPHLYKATPGDVRKLNGADAVFYSGLHLEGRLADLLEKLAKRRPVYAVTDGLHEREGQLLRKLSGSDDHYDPHVWFDVSLWIKCAEYVAEKLAALDAAHADDYRRNAEEYIARLTELHESCKRQLSEIPKPQRVMVTAHDAFGYFGDAYDVEVHGLQGISTADEADLATANKLVEMLTDRKIKAVFVESSVPPKNIRSLVEACAARGHTVAVCEKELYSDAMGPRGTPEETYVGTVEYNVRTIVEALK